MVEIEIKKNCCELVFQTFQLVDKKPFKIPSLADFQWSPTDNRLAYWTSEDGNLPARLILAELNGVKLDEVRSKVK